VTSDSSYSDSKNKNDNFKSNEYSDLKVDNNKLSAVNNDDTISLEGVSGSGKGDLGNQVILMQQLPASIKYALAGHKWAPVCYAPLRFIIAHSDHKEILRSVVETRTIKHKDETYETVHELKLTDVIIGAIPTEVTLFENPLGYTEYKYRINFITNMGKRFTVGPKPLESIIAELREKALIYSTYNGEEALVAIINAYDKSGGLKLNNDVDTPGFYLVKGRIKGYNTNHPRPSIEEIIKSAELLDILQTKYKQKEILPTIIKWGLVAPFGYVLKQLSGNWIPWLHLYGWPNTGKTTSGDLLCSMWGRYHHIDHKIPYTSLDTVAKFGEALSKTTYPITVNEVGSLGDNRHRPLLEMFKTAIEGMTARSKFIRKTHYTNIPALAAGILTGNAQPPTDPAYRRRSIPICFTQADEHTQKEREEFDRLMNERVPKELKTLGDFAANYILDNQADLLSNNKLIDWKELSRRILEEFYNAAGREAPEWISYFVEETQLADSKEDMELLLRAYLLQKINETYNRHCRNVSSLDSSFTDRLDFCLQHKLIPFLNLLNNVDKEQEVVITTDLMHELRQLKVDWSISSLTEVAGIIPDFKYGQKKRGGKNVRAAYGSKEKFIEFLDAE
jgi:hypothetical protein